MGELLWQMPACFLGTAACPSASMGWSPCEIGAVGTGSGDRMMGAQAKWTFSTEGFLLGLVLGSLVSVYLSCLLYLCSLFIELSSLGGGLL